MTLQHASAYADEPQRAAEHLAALLGGSVARFHPLAGAWLWSAGEAMLELYPKTHRLAPAPGGEAGFEPLPARATGAGTHFNLSVDRPRAELERICRERGQRHGWRSWGGFLDVWLDEGLLIECLPRDNGGA